MDYSKRKNMRLPGFDYGQAGGYYITICTHDRACILSRVLEGKENQRAKVQLTELGIITEKVLCQLAEQYGVCLDAWTIMPNHIHMVLTIENNGEIKPMPVGRFVGAFKSIVSNQWQKECARQGITMGKLWQRNFYDHIIRNEADYLEKLRYIDENPDKWSMDEMYGL